MGTPFRPLEENIQLETPAADTQPPAGAVVWTSSMYSDTKSWNSVNKEFALKPTTFADNRLFFLDPVEGRSAPQEVLESVTGKFDVRTWRFGTTVLAIEGELTMYLKLPSISTVISWTSPERVPVLPRNWRPVIYLLNRTNIAVRYIPEGVLYLTYSTPAKAWNVTPFLFSGGFCCVHPCTDTAITYGAYSINGAEESLALPSLPSASKIEYFVHFFPWGLLVVPKENAYRTGCFGFMEAAQIGLLIHPPNLFLHLHLGLPMSMRQRPLTYISDYVLTAKKTSESDIEIYMILDGQLAVYEYSFDTRINRSGMPLQNVMVKFHTYISDSEKGKVKAAKKANNLYKPSLSFSQTQTQKVLVPAGSPLGQGHLLHEQTVAIYDATSGLYCSNAMGLKLTKMFTQLVADVRSEKHKATHSTQQHPAAIKAEVKTKQEAEKVVAASLASPSTSNATNTQRVPQDPLTGTAAEAAEAPVPPTVAALEPAPEAAAPATTQAAPAAATHPNPEATPASAAAPLPAGTGA